MLILCLFLAGEEGASAQAWSPAGKQIPACPAELDTFMHAHNATYSTFLTNYFSFPNFGYLFILRKYSHI